MPYKVRHFCGEHLARIYHPYDAAGQTGQKDEARGLLLGPPPNLHLLGFHGRWKGLQQIKIAPTRRDARLSA